MHIARLVSSDASKYRELMLEAYATAPDAFTSTAEERALEPLAWWEKRIAAADGLSQAFGVFAGDTLVGTVTVEYASKPKTCHSALVIGMYVRPQARGQGLGRQLMQAAIADAVAKPGLQVLRLTVTEDNAPALGLYASLGFTAWGVEPYFFRAPSGFRGRVHMAMHLRSNETAA